MFAPRVATYYIPQILFSRWIILLPFVIYTIQWTAVYYYDYFTIPPLTGVHLLPDRERWCVLDNVIQPTRAVERNRITLILHVSSDYLSEDIAEMFHNWNGPMALSIVLNDANQIGCVARFMRSLIARHHFHMLQVHFIYKKYNFRGCHIRKVDEFDQAPCSNRGTERSIIEVADYPMNMARNVARQFIRTEFLLLSDVDLMFSEGFERRMSEVARRELTDGSKKVLVFRIFEVYKKSSSPRTKSELAQQLHRREADVFHVVAAFGAHDLAGRSAWLSKPENFTHTSLVPEIIRFSRYTWEPRFVSRASVPFHDEAFPYRIRANSVLGNRVKSVEWGWMRRREVRERGVHSNGSSGTMRLYRQGWEMCRAGYEFALVEDLFTFHRAKRTNDQARQGENHKIQLLNRLKYERALAKWHRRMDEEYSETKGSCPAILRRMLWFYVEE